MRVAAAGVRLAVPRLQVHAMRRKPLLSTFACLLLVTTPVLSSSFAGSSAGTSAGGTSASSGSTSGDDKVVLAARADAARFVATDGRVRGAMLESALRHLRERDPQARGRSDMRLAQAILAL